MAKISFVFKGIKPQQLKVDAIRLEILNELRKEGTVQKKELDKTTATWKGAKPTFKTLTGLSRGLGGGASVATGPGGNTEGANKWHWLNGGTKKRWALMSGNWKSKTKPGSFKSGGGRGRVVVVGRRHMARPQPGIKARGWADKLQKQRKKPFTLRMIKAMQRAGKNAF